MKTITAVITASGRTIDKIQIFEVEEDDNEKPLESKLVRE
jgi:hypothetical protein